MQNYVYTIQRGQDREMNKTWDVTVWTTEDYDAGNGVHAAEEIFYTEAQARQWIEDNYSDADKV